MTNELNPIADIETIKLIKNTRGYGWEIKLLGLVSPEQIQRLNALNQEMIEKFGGQTSE